MEIKFCGRTGCYEAAVRAPRSSDLCRADYLAALDADDPALSASVADTPLVRCEVVGEVSAITDALTAQGVGRGQVVTLDPVETNLAALVYAGHVKVLPAEPAKAAKAAKAG